MENRDLSSGGSAGTAARSGAYYQLIVVLVAAVIYLGCVISPPFLMDDVDAVQAQIARNMLESGDWVTARLNGIAYLEKSPLKYWMIAVSFRIFGVHDWAARLPIAICAVLLSWVTARFGAWAFGWRAGMYAGLVLATSVGLFLFTRILIPDVILTLTVTLALWAFVRALDADEPRPVMWAMVMWAAMATGLLLKGLVAAVFPVAAGLLYLAVTRQLASRRTWKRLRPFSGALLFLAIAAPWHVLATVRNPPIFDFTMHSEPGSYRGFFWFYFINEHVLRFLNLRYPRDYNTVPRLYFWLFHLLWLFPWSVYLPAVLKLSYRKPDRASRVRLLALCWCGFILVFFSFSTTQEYYSMPCYPALALLLGSALVSGSGWLRYGTKIAAAVAALGAAAIGAILWLVRGMDAPGDIAAALNQNPEVYTLSLGHMTDLTLRAFAYLRTPLWVAGIAFLIGAAGSLMGRRRRWASATVVMMIVFFHAARLALVVFDPYMGSQALAQALLDAPPGKLIVDNQYYKFSSIFFYTNRQALLLNGRVNNLEYGSYAPDAPQNVFIDDQEFERLWARTERYYLVAEGPGLARISNLFHVKQGKESLVHVKQSGGKFLVTNF
jgi:4-amino-4-deoxy-L-arabinose transferase-like glycosyltransferase